MSYGGDASDQTIRLALQGMEIAIKLTGSASKNVAAALVAYSKDKTKNKAGQTRLAKLLNDGGGTKVFRLEEKSLAEFKKQAIKYGIQYSAIKDQNSTDKLCDVIIKDKDVARVNHVLGKMNYVDIEKLDTFTKDQQQEQEHPQEIKKKDYQQQSDYSMPSSKSVPDKVDIREVLEDIKQNNKQNITPQKYIEFLKLQSHRYGYSDKNMQRIMEQKSDATIVMSRSNWYNLGRYIKKNAKPILVTVPEYIDGKQTGKFVDGKVYNIDDTYGKEISKSNYIYTLENDSPAIVSEIERLESTSLVPIAYVKELETDSYYDTKTKSISIKEGLSHQDTYKAIIMEQTFANAHNKQGDDYSRAKNIFVAESTAFIVANKYGIDTSEFRFDYIPDEVNGIDGKDLGEIFNPIANYGRNKIKEAEKNIDKYKTKDKPSVKGALKSQKDAIDKGIAGVNGATKGKKSIGKNR